jgi:hypothetical protein
MRQSTSRMVNEPLSVESLALKTMSGTLYLSTETAALLGEAMADLQVDDPEFALQAALKSWIRLAPTQTRSAHTQKVH